jgi:four helix bundle protein
MAKIERFEDMLSWQKAREITKHVYGISKRGEFARDFELRGQMRSASVSIMSNIAKGFERGGDKEFIQFLSTAKGSCGEVRSQLYVALDQSYITPVEFDNLYTGTVEIGRLVSGFMGYLQKSDLRGNKFKRT